MFSKVEFKQPRQNYHKFDTTDLPATINWIEKGVVTDPVKDDHLSTGKYSWACAAADTVESIRAINNYPLTEPTL